MMLPDLNEEVTKDFNVQRCRQCFQQAVKESKTMDIQRY